MDLLKFFLLLYCLIFAACKSENLAEPKITPVESLPDDGVPMVSIVVPTYPPRHMYHELLYENFLAQNYPKNKLELVVFDSGPKKSLFFGNQNLDRVVYHYSSEQITLGEKRNWLVEHAKGSVIVSFDDDDFYGSDYVSYMVEKLSNKDIKLVKLVGWPMASLGPKGEKIQFDWVRPRYTDYGWGFSWVYRKDIFTESTCRFANRNRIEEDPFAQCIESTFGEKSIKRIDERSGIILKFENLARYLGANPPLSWSDFNGPKPIEAQKLFSASDWQRIEKLIKIFNLQGRTNFFGFNHPIVPEGCELGPCIKSKLRDHFSKIENSKEALEANKLIPKKPQNGIRIATYNVQSWNSSDFKKAVNPLMALKNLLEIDADIIGLQEVKLTVQGQASLDEFTKASGLNSQFCKAADMGSPFGNMLLSKFAIENVKNLDLGEKTEGRCAVLTTLKTPLGMIDVSSVHLDVYDNTGKERASEINILLDEMLKRPGNFAAQIVMGDMNAINADEISPFMLKRLQAAYPTVTVEIPIFKQRGFLDSFFMMEVAAPFSTTWAGRRVDYIFTKDTSELKPIGCYIYHSDASDHRMLICDFVAEPKD